MINEQSECYVPSVTADLFPRSKLKELERLGILSIVEALGR